jgi:uncharacterized protein YodC (DUF2158 family)
MSEKHEFDPRYDDFGELSTECYCGQTHEHADHKWDDGCDVVDTDSVFARMDARGNVRPLWIDTTPRTEKGDHMEDSTNTSVPTNPTTARPSIGDLVRLKSGGPPMTVTDVYGDGRLDVVWFTITQTLDPYAMAPSYAAPANRDTFRLETVDVLPPKRIAEKVSE